MKILKKVLFCFNITSDLASFFRLIIHSKKFSLSKSRHIPQEKINNYFPVNIKFRKLTQTIFLRTYKGDIDIFYEIFQKKIYSVPAVTQDVSVIIDLGANIGLSAIYFTALFPNSRILCVEPGEENFHFLLRNLAPGIQSGNILTLKAAVMGSDGMASYVDSRMQYNGKVTNGDIKNTEAYSMNSLFNKYNIQSADLIKMDIEGAEKELFQNNTEWLSDVKCLIIEMHSDDIRDSCIAKLQQNNFNVSKVNADPDNEYVFSASKD